MPQRIERILRDVLDEHGFLYVSPVRIERTPVGWRVTMSDGGRHLLTTELVDGSSEDVRAALTSWVLSH
jgi:hypothetical protein